MEIEETKPYRKKSPRKRLQVIFPDGVELCYTNATVTYIEALKKIGIPNILKANLQLCHLPLISKVPYEGYEDYMKPLVDGWWVNVQSDTSQKYLQLRAIRDNLNLKFDVNLLSLDSVKAESVKGKRRNISPDTFHVMFPDMTIEKGSSDQDRFLYVIDRIGPENVFYRGFMCGTKDLVTRYEKYPGQLPSKTQNGFWVTIPGSVEKKVRLLESINDKMRLGLEVVKPGDYDHLVSVLSRVLNIDLQSLGE